MIRIITIYSTITLFTITHTNTRRHVPLNQRRNYELLHRQCSIKHENDKDHHQVGQCDTHETKKINKEKRSPRAHIYAV